MYICIYSYNIWPTPANGHSDGNVAFDVWFEHSYQFPVQVNGFCCHPEEDSQEEVMHQCGDQPAEYRYTSRLSADDISNIQPQQSKAKVDQELCMDCLSQTPAWCA